MRRAGEPLGERRGETLVTAAGLFLGRQVRSAAPHDTVMNAPAP